MEIKQILKNAETALNNHFDDVLLDVANEESKILGVNIEQYVRSELIKAGNIGYHDSTYNSPNPDYIFYDYSNVYDIKSHKNTNVQAQYCISRRKKRNNEYTINKSFDLICINYDIILKDNFKDLENKFKESCVQNIHKIVFTDCYIVKKCKFGIMGNNLTEKQIKDNYEYEHLIF